MKKISSIIFIFLLSFLLLYIAACSPAKTNSTGFDVKSERIQANNIRQASELLVGSKKGNLAPDFSIATIGGETFKLGDKTKDEKPVLLYFFATWCPYCYQDFTTVKNIYPDYKNEIEFLAIDLDPTESEETIRDYQKKLGLNDIKFAKAYAGVLEEYS